MLFFTFLLLLCTLTTTNIISMEQEPEQRIVNIIGHVPRRNAKVRTYEQLEAGDPIPQRTFPIPHQQDKNRISLEPTTTHVAIIVPEMAPRKVMIPLGDFLSPNQSLFVANLECKKYVEIKNITTQKRLIALSKVGTSNKIGKKGNHADLSFGTLTIRNKNLPFVVLEAILHQKPLDATEYPQWLSPEEKKAIQKNSKIFSAITQSIRQKDSFQLIIPGKEINDRIVDRFVMIRIAGALQPLKIRFPNDIINLGDTLTIQKPDDSYEITITNQDNKCIAQLFTNKSRILIVEDTQ